MSSLEVTDPILDPLTESQRAAVTHRGGPLLVLAGAGSGKTRVITHRIAHLLRGGVPPSTVLGITFTNKAAREMRERVDRLCGEGRVRLLTFHSFAARTLREEPDPPRFDRNYSILDEGDRLALVKGILREKGIDSTHWQPMMVISTISRAKSDLLTPETFWDQATSNRDQIVGEVFKEYEDALQKMNALDFDDLLAQLVRILRKRPEARERLRKGLGELLVDEYQDTNHVQLLIVQAILPEGRGICVVGDPDQSIYRWRGAEVRNILEFEKEFAPCNVVRLEENFRSTAKILEAAHEVIRHNVHRDKKKLWTRNPPGEAVEAHSLDTEWDEAEWIALSIADRLARGRGGSEIAIFYRVNHLSRVLEGALRDRGIPYTIVGGVEFYQRKEVKDLLAYLKLARNAMDDISFLRAVKYPSRGIGRTTVDRLRAAAGDGGLLETAGRAREIQEIGPRGEKALAAFCRLVREIRALPSDSARTVVEGAIRLSGYEKALRAEKSPQAVIRLENVLEMVTAAEEFDRGQPGGGIDGFLEEVALISDVDEWEDGTGKVNLMTLHSAKGLEFPVVYLAGMEERLFPHERSMESDEELEEERRLCYVGVTRAREELVLTSARVRTLFGAPRPTLPSRFLDEMARALGGSFEPGALPPPRPEPGEADAFRVGEWVAHDEFGRGRVLEISGEGVRTRASILFDGVGRKRLVLHYAALRREGGG